MNWSSMHFIAEGRIENRDQRTSTKFYEVKKLTNLANIRFNCYREEIYFKTIK